METRAHLLLLVARGRLSSTLVEGHEVYHLTGPAAPN